MTSKKQAKQKRAARKKGSRARPISQLGKPQAIPSMLRDPAVKRSMEKLKSEDAQLLDRAELQKEDTSFMGLARRLKTLMVRKKRL